MYLIYNLIKLYYNRDFLILTKITIVEKREKINENRFQIGGSFIIYFLKKET
jgi:hypothetical protein